MMEVSVSIWGCGGFVGQACYQTFLEASRRLSSSRQELRSRINVYGYDIVQEKSKNSKEECFSSDLHFVCVPTPMSLGGRCDTNIVEKVLKELSGKIKDNAWVVLKSTLPVGFTEKVSKTLKVCFNPEFLTEANALLDFQTLQYQIVGVDDVEHYYESCKLGKLYDLCLSVGVMQSTGDIVIPSKEAELVKLARNSYLATRISFFNEIYQLAIKLGINYHSLIEHIGLDSRIGDYYNEVPGPDGHLSFGGTCLPKDINNLIDIFNQSGIEPIVLNACWKQNQTLRPENDWRQKGRSISDD